MNVFASYDDLRRLGRVQEIATLSKTANFSSANKDTFLSHSSKDNELLPGVVAVLESHGSHVYIDNADQSLPKNPSVETAQILRGNLASTRKFVLLVTPNSKDSIWIPWELGIADGEKSPSNVALFPSSESQYEKNWAEQEYLGLYKRIVWANFKDEEPEWLVYDHHNNVADRLRQWLNN